MPRPRMNDDVETLDENQSVEPDDTNVTGAHVGDVTVSTEAGSVSVGTDAPQTDPATGEAKVAKPRGAKRLKVPEGTFGLLDTPERADVPKRSGGRGRGRTVSPQTLKTIEMLKEHPGESFKIGRYAAAAVAEGIWKQNGISFSSSAVVITNTDGEEVTVFDRYATYTPGTEVSAEEAPEPTE